MQLCSVDLNPGSSDTSRLHHAVEVQPQRDQSHIPEVHQWGSRCHVCLGPQNRPPGSVSKKVGDDIAKATSDWKSQDYSETDHSEHTGPS